MEQAEELVYDFGLAAENEDEKSGGARFLSVDDDGWRPGGAGDKSILERLAEKAALALEARRPQQKKREIKARFGGARAALGDAGGAGAGNEPSSVEAEFLRELEENVPQSFIPPQVEEDDEPAEEDTAKPFFFTEDVWEDIDYNERKEKVVKQLAAASEKIAKSQIALPRLKVENDRLEYTCSKIQEELHALQDEEKRIFLRHPEIKKKYAKDAKEEEAGIVAPQMSLDDISAEQKREQQRQDEKLRRRMLRRKNLAMQGLHDVEEAERDKGEVLLRHSLSVLQRLQLLAMAWRLRFDSLIFNLDPYRLSFVAIRNTMPRAVAYFRMLRRTNYINSLFLLAAGPQILQWVSGARDGFCSDDTFIMPCVLRYSAVQRFLFGSDGAGKAGEGAVDMSMIFIYMFGGSYVLVYLVSVRRLFVDAYSELRASAFQERENPFKFSQVVFNSWDCSVHSRAEHRSIFGSVVATLRLLMARRTEEGTLEPQQGDTADGEAFGDEEANDEVRIQVNRYGGALVLAGFMVGFWVIEELFLPTTLTQYPVGWERIITPAGTAIFNQWIAPTVARYYVMHARLSRAHHAQIVLAIMFLARLLNAAIILRKQFRILTDPTRVHVLARARDTCFCEDEVGANFAYFWGCDWAASLLKVVSVPLFHRVYHQVHHTHRIRLGGKWISAWRPSFEISVWLIDIIFNQLLFFFALPFLPSSAIFAVGTGAISFAVQRYSVLHLWEPPKNVIYDPRLVRLSFSACQVVSLHVATLVYFYVWVYGATDKWTAPVCKLPVLYHNATTGQLCTFDAVAGTNVTASPCPAYVNEACRDTSGSQQFIALYASSTPASLVTDRLSEVVAVLGAPVIAWLVSALVFLRFLVQHQYRRRFEEYVGEQRFRLLMKLSTLERSLKKQEKILEIQSSTFS